MGARWRRGCDGVGEGVCKVGMVFWSDLMLGRLVVGIRVGIRGLVGKMGFRRLFMKTATIII